MDRPLYPDDGAPYYAAMAAAAEEYDAWVAGRKGQKGIRVYTRAELDKERDK